MKQIDCNIIRDLLPSYVEKLTSEQSNQAIDKHINDCSECKEYLNELQQDVAPQAASPNEIDYLKKIKRKMKKSTYISLGILSIALVIALGVFLRFYVIGWPAEIFSTEITIDYDYNNDNVVIQGQLLNGNRIGRVVVRDANNTNITKLTVYEVLPSFLFNKRDFTTTIPLRDDIYVIWQERDNQQDLFWESEFLPYVSVCENNVYTQNGSVADRTVYAKLIALFDSAKSTSTTVEHKEPELSSYISISIPKTQHTLMIKSDAQQELIPFKDVSFVYEQNGKFMLQQYGQPLKELDAEQWHKFQGYISNLDVR
jgi:hypothetical protein